MKSTFFTLFFLLSAIFLFSQEWQQLSGEPEGGGVTDIFYQTDTETLFVATGSLNWPNGEDGGLRRSADDGATWQNIFDAYTSRVIMEGPDGNLYASVWDFPTNEGLYRSSDNGDTWEQLTSVPENNNIFSIAIREGNPNIIFAGTRTGVLRSLDNGNTWSYANTNIPGDAWVRALEVGPDGTIAAGTTYGLYVSSDNGDTWDKVTGDGQNDNIISIAFDTEPAKAGGNIITLIFGNDNGDLFITTSATVFLVAYLTATIAPGKEITRIKAIRDPNTKIPRYFASAYAIAGGAFLYSVSQLINWQLFMNGLLPNPLISVFAAQLVVAATTVIVLYIAMYGNSKNALSGSEIYKATFDITTSAGGLPFAENHMSLFQNMPNPFKDQTRINFRLNEKGFTTLKLFDMAGNEVRSILDKQMDAGKHSIQVLKENLRPGIYYYVLRSGAFTETKKLVIN